MGEKNQEISTREFSNKKLALGLWYTRNRILLKRGLIGALIFINFLLFGFSIFQAIKILVVENRAYQQALFDLTQNHVNYNSIAQNNTVADLAFSQLTILPGTDNKKNIAIKVKNPNPNQFAKTLDYEFVSGETVLYSGRSYLYPEEEKYLIAFSQDLSGSGADVKVIVNNIEWKRYTEQIKQLSNNARQFVVSGLTHENVSDSSITQTKFMVKNDSTYSYWTVDVTTLLLSGQRLIGASVTSIDGLNPLEEKQVTLNWLDPSALNGTVEIFADVNILDENNFRTYAVDIEDIEPK